jgi:hypothetical protein
MVDQRLVHGLYRDRLLEDIVNRVEFERTGGQGTCETDKEDDPSVQEYLF